MFHFFKLDAEPYRTVDVRRYFKRPPKDLSVFIFKYFRCMVFLLRPHFCCITWSLFFNKWNLILLCINVSGNLIFYLTKNSNLQDNLVKNLFQLALKLFSCCLRRLFGKAQIGHLCYHSLFSHYFSMQMGVVPSASSARCSWCFWLRLELHLSTGLSGTWTRESTNFLTSTQH